MMLCSFVFLFFALFVSFGLADNTETKALGCSYGYFGYSSQCYDCGTTSFTPNVKIVGGVSAIQGSWPAHALVIQAVTVNYLGLLYKMTYECGGTLISRNTILTAAHCINTKGTVGNTEYDIVYTTQYPTLASTFTVYLGAYDISFVGTNSNVPSGVVKAGVSNVTKHPSYTTGTELNDIALLQLDQTVTLSDYIKVACLPDQSSIFPSSNQAAYAAGWGKTSETSTSETTILQNIKLTVYDPSSCSNVYPSTTKNWNSQICAGEYSGGKDTCQGDSGGGLMIKDTINGQTKYVVAGIVSYGYGCARAGYPGIYTRTSYYIDWIQANIGSTSTSGGSGNGNGNKSRKLVGSFILLVFSLSISTHFIKHL